MVIMPLVLIDGAYGGNGRSALTKSEEDKKALAPRKADNALLVGFVIGISVGVKVLIHEGFVVVLPLPLPPESKKQYCTVLSLIQWQGMASTGSVQLSDASTNASRRSAGP
jgi:hypothetical protein